MTAPDTYEAKARAWLSFHGSDPTAWRDLAALIRAEVKSEREACAEVADLVANEEWEHGDHPNQAARMAAERIRARGATP